MGKYKAILYFCYIYLIGLVILFTTSLPVSLEHGAGLGGFITAIIVIGVGTGGIKSNVAPLIADQYKRRRMAVSFATAQLVNKGSSGQMWLTSMADLDIAYW